jgi:hypothetical protein
MMPAYQTIFYGIPSIVGILAGVGLLSLVFQKQAILARSIVFSFQFWIAPLFYFTYMAIVHRIFALVVIAGCLELLFMAIYLVLFNKLLAAVTTVSPQFHSRMLSYLKVGTWILIGISVYTFIQPGAGIFSEGSRIEYLAGSRLNLYLVYASVLVQAAMIPVVAAIINNEKRWNRPVVLYLVLISINSVLGGSKGGVLLAMLAIASLLKFKHAREYIRVLWGPICGTAALFSITVYIVGRFLLLEPSQMVSIMFNRLFLANDARSLAIDWSKYLASSGTSLFSESFRNLATLIGDAPKYPPLGQFLYSLQFGTVGLAGGNSSSTALLIAYGSDLERVLFTVLLAIAALAIGLLAEIPGRSDVIRLAIGISLLALLSQDLLAFELCINTFVLLSAAVLTRAIFVKLLRKASATGAMTRNPQY